MEIENVTALLKQHAYDQGLNISNGTDAAAIDNAPVSAPGESPVWETTPQMPWTSREPFSPPTMGYALPYLDVMTVQSKRLLPVSRKELDSHRVHRSGFQSRPHPEHPALDTEAPEPRGEGENDDEDDVTPRRKPKDPVDEVPLDFDAILRSVRLLVEPIAIPDLTHTGVKWQLAKTNEDQEDKLLQLCVTVPNHSFDETQVKLFYPTGAKNANMREYIQDTIQKHMAGFTKERTSPTKAPSLGGSQSTPDLSTMGSSNNTSPVKKIKHKAIKSPSKSSPTKASPQKRSAVSSGARLSGSVSTSGLINPELTRQTKDILSQLRANANKMNDLIGS